jgi:hypothetical protein
MATADSIRKPATECRGLVAFCAQTGELLVRTEDHELAELDAWVTEHLAQLVECGLDRRRLRDRVATTFRRHPQGVAPVLH